MQWAMTRRLDDDPLLAACLRDQRHDPQVEEPRGEWLWKMVRAVDAVDRFRVPILHALYELSDDRSASQLCDLARHYAEAADETFRTRLYEIVEQKPIAGSPWLGEEEIVQLEGEKAFLFAARVRGKQLASREWEWDDENLINYAIERFGEGRVIHLLEHTTDEAIRLFCESWLQQEQTRDGREQRRSRRDEMRAITVSDITSAAATDNTRFGSLFRGWGMHADEADLGMVLQHLLAAEEQKVIVNLLKVFSNRSVPQFDARLIELCHHSDSQVRNWAFNALENNAHPSIRKFAFAELEKGVRDGSVVSLFIRNYEQGDEQLILDAIELPDDDCERHWFLMDVIKVLENNPDADCSQLGIISYASTPCENCRYDSARLLHRQRVAPRWLIEECRFDSCRELVDEITGPTQAESESR